MKAMKDEMYFFYNSEQYEDSKALGYAETLDQKINIQDISKDHLTQTQIAELAEKMNMSIADLVNTNHEDYINDYKNKDLPDTEWLKLLEEKPELLRTPIAMTSSKTFIVEDPYTFVNRDMDNGGIKNETANKDEK